jgi:hypothetical protein
VSEPRYRIFATISGVPDQPYDTADDMHGALKLIRKALETEGITYAYQKDSRPGEPQPTTEAERAAMAELTKSVTRNMG